MDKKLVKEFLTYCQTKTIGKAGNIDTNLYSYELLTYCISKGYLEMPGNKYMISAKGFDFINDCENKSVVYNGHNITGNIYNSDLSLDDKSINKTIDSNKNIIPTASQPNFMVKILKATGWLIATSAGIIAILKAFSII